MFGRTTWVLVALDLTLCVYFLKPIPYSFLFPLTGLSWYLGLQLVCIYLNGDIIVQQPFREDEFAALLGRETCPWVQFHNCAVVFIPTHIIALFYRSSQLFRLIFWLLGIKSSKFRSPDTRKFKASNIICFNSKQTTKIQRCGQVRLDDVFQQRIRSFPLISGCVEQRLLAN